MQKQYVAKATKILGEQFLTSASPPAKGVCTCNLSIPYEASGHPPHVHAVSGVAMLHETDWILYNRQNTDCVGVASDADFQEDYTGPG
jgi:hypothetical protein